jgi:hypothetical protein
MTKLRRGTVAPLYDLTNEQAEIQALRERYWAYLDRHYAPNTVRAYKVRANRYLNICGLPDLNGVEIVKCYLNKFELSPNSISTEIGALVTLYKFDGLPDVARSLNVLRV